MGLHRQLVATERSTCNSIRFETCEETASNAPH